MRRPWIEGEPVAPRDLHYYRTLITVAEDCPVSSAVVPVPRAGARTVAAVQHELLAERPYALTQEDVLFETWLRRQEPPVQPSPVERASLRQAFFARPQACLRGSPLPKKYGWGLLFDAEGRIALCPMESEEYRRIRDTGSDLAGEPVQILKALRSARAGRRST